MNESKPQAPRAVEMKNHLGLPRHRETHVSRMVGVQSKWIIGAVEFCVAATHAFLQILSEKIWNSFCNIWVEGLLMAPTRCRNFIATCSRF
jgi:hypothetical protein